jgi:hypothetical protein
MRPKQASRYESGSKLPHSKKALDFVVVFMEWFT